MRPDTPFSAVLRRPHQEELQDDVFELWKMAVKQEDPAKPAKVEEGESSAPVQESVEAEVRVERIHPRPKYCANLQRMVEIAEADGNHFTVPYVQRSLEDENSVRSERFGEVECGE